MQDAPQLVLDHQGGQGLALNVLGEISSGLPERTTFSKRGRKSCLMAPIFFS